MPLQGSGALKLSQINTELGVSSTSQISMSDARIRATANVNTGQINVAALLGKDYYTLNAHKFLGINPNLTERYVYTNGPIQDSVGNLYYFAFSNYEPHLVKTDMLGHILWQKKIGYGGGDSMAISSSDEIYVSTNGDQILKLDTSGNIIWQKTYPESSIIYADNILGLTIDTSGNVYFYTNGILSGSNDRAAWIYKINSSGVVQWANKIKWTDTSDSIAYPDICISPTGDVVVSCITNYNYYVYLTKFNSAGVLQWKKVTQGTSGSIFATSVKQDSSGNIFIVGTDDNLPFLSKINSSGVTQWTRKLTTLAATGYNGGYGGLLPLVVDSSDNVYFATQFSLKSDNSKIGYSVFKYNTSGTLQHYRNITLDTNVPPDNFYYLGASQLQPRLRVSRDNSKLDVMCINWRTGTPYFSVALRIPLDSTTVPATAMSWGGNTEVATGAGFTAATGTTYTWSTSTLVVSSFTSTPTTPTNTLTNTTDIAVRLNALN